jgi:hypothetical protein
MRYDYSYIQAVQSRARRERAEAVHRLILAPLLALLTRPFKTSFKTHATRPHLARQG